MQSTYTGGANVSSEPQPAVDGPDPLTPNGPEPRSVEIGGLVMIAADELGVCSVDGECS